MFRKLKSVVFLKKIFRFCVESLKEWEIKCFKLFKADKSQRDSIVSAIVLLNKELYCNVRQVPKGTPLGI